MADFDLSALRSLTPENDEVAFDLAILSFGEFIRNTAIEGPTHFCASIGQFDMAFRDFYTLPMAAEDYVLDGLSLPEGVTVSDGQKFHRVTLALLDATLDNPTKVVSFAVIPSEDGNSSSDVPASGDWGDEEARNAIGVTMVEGAAHIQALGLSDHFSRNTFGPYGNDASQFVLDCMENDLPREFSDTLLERKFLLDTLQAHLIASSLMDDFSDNEVMSRLYKVMCDTHAVMLAEVEEIVTDFYNKCHGGE